MNVSGETLCVRSLSSFLDAIERVGSREREEPFHHEKIKKLKNVILL
jgi:hypothetical protein